MVSDDFFIRKGRLGKRELEQNDEGQNDKKHSPS
jgi:hypothetical protein